MTFDLGRLTRDYGDPFAEACACRSTASLFDFSFVARGRIRGQRALPLLAKLTSRRLDDMVPGQIRYAVRADDDGHLRTDLTVWRIDEETFEVMSGSRDDIFDLVRIAPAGTAADLSQDTAIFAVQGPRSLEVLQRVGFAMPQLAQLAYYRFMPVRISGFEAVVGRLGYTGEAGFEVILPASAAAETWARLAAHAQPSGFAAADILRIEAGFVLFAHEFRLPVTAVEAGVETFAPSGKPCSPDRLRLVCFTAETVAKPVLWQPLDHMKRPGPGEITVTSACWSPHLDRVLGLGYVRVADIDSGQRIRDPSGEFDGIRFESRPAFDPGKTRPRAPWPV